MESGIHRHGIRNPQRGIRNPRLSWITLHGARLCVVTEEVVVVTPGATDVADEDWLSVVALGANIASVLTANRTLSKVTRTYTFPHKMINNTSE